VVFALTLFVLFGRVSYFNIFCYVFKILLEAGVHFIRFVLYVEQSGIELGTLIQYPLSMLYQSKTSRRQSFSFMPEVPPAILVPKKNISGHLLDF